MTAPDLCPPITRHYRMLQVDVRDTGVPYQNLINLCLLNCAKTGRKLSITWKK